MADHRQPASFRQEQGSVVQQEIETGFTLHLPPTSRPPVTDALENSTDRAGKDDDDEEEEDASSSSCKEANPEDQCPDCGQRTLRKCLIQEEFALILCVDKSCGYPFAQTNIMDYIVRVRTDEILEAARRRMLNAGVGEDTAKKIVQANKVNND
ncbi:hypothetical protein V1509DRAFT_642739 [Lipomyces kononenkoae]